MFKYIYMEGTDDIIKQITEGEAKLQKYNEAVRKDYDDSMLKISQIKELIKLIRVKINKYIEITINYNKLKTDHQKIQMSVDQAKQTGDALQADIDANNKKIAEKDERISKLTEQVSQQTGDLDASKTVKTQLEALLKEKEEITRELSALKNANTELTTENSNLSVEVAGDKTQMEQLKEQIDKLKKHMTTSGFELDELYVVIDGLEKEKVKIEQENIGHQERMAGHENDSKELAQRLSEVQRQMEAVSTEKSKMEASIKGILAIISGLPDAPKSLQVDLDEIIRMLKELQNMEVSKTSVTNINVGESALDAGREIDPTTGMPEGAFTAPRGLPSNMYKGPDGVPTADLDLDSDDEGGRMSRSSSLDSLDAADVRKGVQGEMGDDDTSVKSFETSRTGPEGDKSLTVSSDPHTTKAVLNGKNVEIPGYIKQNYNKTTRLPQLVKIMKKDHEDMRMGEYPEDKILKMQRSQPFKLKDVLYLDNQSLLASDPNYGLTSREARQKFYDNVKKKFNEWQEKEQAGRENPGINELAGNIIPGTSYFEVEFPFHENKKIRREETAFRRGGRNKKKTKKKNGGKSKNKTIKYRRRNNRKRGKK